MRTSHAAGVELRPLADIFDEAVQTLRQESSEYSFIALVGAVIGGLVVLACGLIDTAISLSLIGPAIALSAILTMATSAACFGAANNNMQPEAGSAALAALRRLPAILLPWLPLVIGLWAASYAMAAFAGEIDKARIPDWAQILLLVAASLLYAYPRSVTPVAAFEEQMPWTRASALSSFIVRESGGRARAIWAVVAAPAALMMALSIVVGLDIVTGALVACFWIGAMPLAAALMSLLFFDAASQIELAPTPAAGAPRTTARRI